MKDENYYICVDSGMIVKVCHYFTTREKITPEINNTVTYDEAISNINILLIDSFINNSKKNPQEVRDFYIILMIMTIKINFNYTRLFIDSVFTSFNIEDKERLETFMKSYC